MFQMEGPTPIAGARFPIEQIFLSLPPGRSRIRMPDRCPTTELQT